MTTFKMKYFLTLILFVFLTSCYVKRKTNTQTKNTIFNKNEKIESIYGRVISIESTKKNNKITIKDTIYKRKHLVLSVLNNKNPSENTIKINNEYNFKVVKLTHTKTSSDTLEINGKKVVMMPNHAIVDCINYNDETFCNEANTDIYKAINLNGLVIYDSDTEW